MKQSFFDSGKIDVISPISVGANLGDPSEVINGIIFQHEKYGINKFMISAPMKGWRSVGYPPSEHFDDCARAIKVIREAVEPHGIEIGWWMVLTLKSGRFSDDSPTVNAAGQKHPFANCPLCREFAERLTDDAARVARIAKPSFIITEDDFSLAATKGCFCERHLEACSRRVGRYYSREELEKAFGANINENLALFKEWKALAGQSLTDLARLIRAKIDKENADIPIGFMQPGGADIDGDCTEAMARALAGERHTPFARLYGTFYYYGYSSKGIPEIAYHPVYSKQHIGENFRYYHESDSFPSTRYHVSGSQMRALMSTMYSYGFDGSTYQTVQALDDPTEESAYGRMLAKERARFDQIHKIAKQCENKGVLISYDPFYNNTDKTLSKRIPLWASVIGRFGIPYTTDRSSVAFFDLRQAKHLGDEEIKKYLSKALFLDGDAAKELCRRGFDKYLGANVLDDVISSTALASDLSAREVITPEFAEKGKGAKMPAANAYSTTGNGIQLRLVPNSEKCVVATELCKMNGEAVCPAMTYFENELGGKVVIMGMTLDKNGSQSLYNYRRMRLLQRLVRLCSDEFATIKDAPDVFLIQNDAKDPNGELVGMLTLINLGEDELDRIELALPKAWRDAAASVLDASGRWVSVNFEKTPDGIAADLSASHLMPVCIRFDKR